MRSAALRTGQHACAIYRSDEEHWEITADFIGSGLSRGEQVLCIDDAGTADAVLRRLHEDGLDHRPHLARGQLIVEPVELPSRTAGVPAPDIAAAIEGHLYAALDAGYPAFRMAFETTSVLRATGDVDWLLEIDAACTPMWRTAPVTALCQIDERLTSPAQRTRIRGLHDWEVDAPSRYDDGLLRITGTVGGRARLAGEIDLGNREALRMELERLVALGGRDVRLSVASLRFTDAASIAVLADAVRALPPGRRLVLERPDALLRKVLAVCALDQLPGLVLETDAPVVVA